MTVTEVTVKVPVPGEVPELVDSAWVARTFGLTPTAVQTAVRKGYLPAMRVGKTFVIRPEDAVLLWGWRLVSGKAAKSKQG